MNIALQIFGTDIIHKETLKNYASVLADLDGSDVSSYVKMMIEIIFKQEMNSVILPNYQEKYVKIIETVSFENVFNIPMIEYDDSDVVEVETDSECPLIVHFLMSYATL
jgi:hypothetical protein